jgi:beta-glucosidase
LNDVLKATWRYPGWVMSDWGATPEWEFALKGLDQESGVQIDAMAWKMEPFVEPLKQAYAEGKLSKERLSDMVRRILRSMFAVGIDSWGEAPEVDMAAHHEIALETARQGIVLLKNDGALPLAADTTARIGLELGRPTRRVRGSHQDRRPSADPFDELQKALPDAHVE